MRKKNLFFLLAVGLCVGAITACGDDDPTPTDTAGTDVTVAEDSTSEDATGADTGGSEDVATAADTAGTEDTSPPVDTSAPEDTTTPEDTSAPEDTAPLAGAICMDHMDCLFSACSASSSEDSAACLEGAVATCGLGDEDPEHTYAKDLASCLGENACALGDTANLLDDSWKDYYKCAAKNCVTKMATCYSGAQAADSDCEALRLCVKTCEPDFLTGLPTNACVRDCASKSSEESLGLYLDLELCVAQQCHGQADYDSCYAQSVGIYCPNEVDLCYGTEN